MDTKVTRLVAIILTLSTSFLAHAADRTFESGPQQVRVLELFTSEGCSSCPPAEAWLSKLKAEPGLWKEFVPLAFHVDYWDRLGWRDPFAAKEWTARQYQYSNGWKSESVYTPAFVLDGREWRGRSIPNASSEKPGVLKLSVVGDKVLAEFRRSNSERDITDVHVATLGFALTTKVTAGENTGRNLLHDFVVLSLTDEKLVDGKAELRVVKDARAGAIAAWVTASNQFEPVQAAGGWLR
ncbi:MAG: DUF1223 domain-containing protein [Chthoniobacterales bacterium]